MIYLLVVICLLVSITIGATVGLVIGLNNNDSSSTNNLLLYENIQVKNAMDTLVVCGVGVVHCNIISVTVAAKYIQSI